MPMMHRDLRPPIPPPRPRPTPPPPRSVSMATNRLTSVLPTNSPLVLAPSQATPWREEEASHSMRSLAYFIGTFVAALMLGIGSASSKDERGPLPLTSTVARYFVARTDSAGRTLTSTCEYSVEGSPLNARWWSLAVYDENGGLIENPSARYSFNSEEALRHSDGTFRINLSSKARPENWLPSGTADQHLVLLLRIYSPRETAASGIGLIPGG